MKYFPKANKWVWIGLGAVVLIAGIVLVRSPWFPHKALEPGKVVFVGGNEAEVDKTTPVAYQVEEFAAGLDVPWELAFTNDTRMLVTERSGAVRVIENGTLQEKPLYVFNDTVSASGDEEGLMGMALDPHYQENHYVYFAYAYQAKAGLRVRVVRLTDNGDALADPQTLLEDIPAAKYHAGCRLAFGPDQRLYITTGDATSKNIAQDLKSMGGKILRINTDGSVPEDNPFEGSLVYTYGHRNSQGIAWDTRDHEMYATEHGPSGFDGPPGGDEFNHVIPGGNYGWPKVSHEKKLKGTEAPLLTFTPAVAPSDLLFYTGATFPQFTDTFLFAALKGEGVYQVIIDPDDPEKVLSYQKLAGIDAGRIRSITEASDGSLYILTSNVDGRGQPVPSDDRILHILPAK